ncbi:ribosomal protein S18-alanine N-acetyltransferase [Bifidobacterium sp. UMB1230]|uniref:ribosomal protein S18-alanine N-acetyltransferase n=1 Tax=Gardnerella TaxID=2701 RepID=UPI00200E0EC4|nr:ribosomal protein S18-alanine N-acetyltransferase [Gardnerella vaginalis]MDK7189467.1 ribosomal protein S18-alanine N-acetyltransferase [Bifidobacterium sp. UMB1230]UQA79725.1 ribosomal protein S18-alanine N-acetyltransferase [Gardnerella vaginalis]
MIVDITRSKYPACVSNSQSCAIEKIDCTKYEAIVSQIAKIEADLFGPVCWNKNMILQELQAPMRAYYADVVPNTNTVAGYAGFWFDGDDAQIMTIGVAKEYQKQGIASNLLKTMIENAKSIGAKRMLLEVKVNNNPALKLYEKFGFTKMGLRKRYYMPEGIDAYTMCAQIDDFEDLDNLDDLENLENSKNLEESSEAYNSAKSEDNNE